MTQRARWVTLSVGGGILGLDSSEQAQNHPWGDTEGGRGQEEAETVCLNVNGQIQACLGTLALGILALRTWRSWWDLTCGGRLANALFSCLQCSEEDALPAKSEWSRGARRHFY